MRERSSGIGLILGEWSAPLAALGGTMPPWPGEGEAYEVEGKWTPTVEAGSG